MSTSKKDWKSLYEIAKEIGSSLNLYEMLRSALAVYLRKLDCVTGIVYRIEPDGRTHIRSQMIFSIPYALITKEMFKEIEKLVPENFSKKSLAEYQVKLPIKGKCKGDMFYHILSLGSFGFIVLIKENTFIDDSLLDSLEEINYKLGLACLNCIKNELLLESEMRFRHQQELLPEMLFEIDNHGVVKYANPYSLEKVGYSQDEFRHGLSFLDLVHHSQHSQFLRNFSELLRSDKVTPNEYLIVKKDGTTFPSLFNSNRLKKNNKTEGIIGVVIDISEIKENERKLELYNERLELALLASEAGLWDWNIQTGHVYFSERWCSMLGYNSDEIEPNVSSWENLVHPDDVAAVMEILTNHLENKIPLYKSEHRARTKSGEWKWVLDTGLGYKERRIR